MMNKPETNDVLNLKRISMVEDYISLHYRDDLKLSELADLVSMTPTSLCHIFKRYHNKRISDIIVETRIQHAKEMLISTDIKIRFVAYECGFSTLTNFNRLFKRLTGMTPTEYKNNKYE